MRTIDLEKGKLVKTVTDRAGVGGNDCTEGLTDLGGQNCAV